MINDKFKEVFELSQKLHQKELKKVYDELSKIDEKIGTFDEFIKQNKKEQEKEIPPEKKQLIESAYLSKDNIKKENINFNLYLFHRKYIDSIKFDDNYKPLPLREKEIYEYGVVVSMEDESGYYDISGVFGGIDSDEHFARDKYNALKSKVEKSSLEDLLEELKADILKQINE